MVQTTQKTRHAAPPASDAEVPARVQGWRGIESTLPRLAESGLRGLSTDSPATPTQRSMLNALTVDLEDWPIAVLSPDCEISPRVVENTKRLLGILQWHHVRATFFVLTKVAQRFPHLIREIHAAGHEIASHGHSHELLTTISRRHFRDDVKQSIDILGELTGKHPRGYRAPAFSIVKRTRWAGQILVDLGFQYSSSIFPIRHPRYGIADVPRGIHRWPDCPLIECPPATLQTLGARFPIGGGGYMRLLPGSLARTAIRRINRESMPAIIYLHPYEFDPDGIDYHRATGERVGLFRNATQTMFRSRSEARLHRLLESFAFSTLNEILAHTTPTTAEC